MDSDLRDTGASFELGGRQVAERLMQPLSIVEHFDVFKDRGARLLSGVELQMMGELILQRADKALGAGVVEAVALGRTRQSNGATGSGLANCIKLSPTDTCHPYSSVNL